MAPGLCSEHGDRAAVVTTEHGEKDSGRHLGQPLSCRLPAAGHGVPELQITEVVECQIAEAPAALVDGWHDCAEAANVRRCLTGAAPVGRRLVVGNAR